MTAEPVVWSQPLPRSPWRTRLIALCVDMCTNGRDDYLTAHWLFARKVLREDQCTAMGLAAAFRHVPLPGVAECEALADEWWEPSSRGES